MKGKGKEKEWKGKFGLKKKIGKKKKKRRKLFVVFSNIF